ncbi:TetR/AcrR family transcriptional regulator [Actinocorallia populi]|uniref:TetR/AcrR family transcriptional regulator n=1 Tax=Actinocorallia populi TaxID=2079200 RepID=UPI0013007BCD|nr:TetR/AcrR family transcriptional regulator [Actinocorallia populi]
MAVNARRGAPLTPEEIYATALRLIDAGGVEGLSMRKLAVELDVNPMSLYHHVDGRTALLQRVCAMVGARLDLPAADGAWPEQLRALGHACRSLARRHPSLWLYAQSHPEVTGHDHLIWQALDPILAAAGVDEKRLVHARKTLFSLLSGFVLGETTGALNEQGGTADLDEAFEAALDFAVAGLASFRS